MTEREFHYLSSNGVSQIYAKMYIPKGESKGIFQICHGMCEYFGRYDAFCRFLAENGYVVAGNDHLGHGKSVSEGEDFGFFAEKNGYRYVLNDVEKLTEMLKEEFPAKPVILFGHSMGSAIARCVTSERHGDYNGAIYSGTPVQPAPAASANMISLIAKMRGNKNRTPFLVNLSTGSYGKKFTAEGSKNAWLSRDPKIYTKYDQDPFCTYSFTNSAYRDLIQLVSKAQNKSWPKNLPSDYPVLVISGSDDPCGNFGKGVKKVYGHMLSCGMTNTKLILYKDARHEILNEINKEDVYNDILSWCEQLL